MCDSGARMKYIQQKEFVIKKIAFRLHTLMITVQYSTGPRNLCVWISAHRLCYFDFFFLIFCSRYCGKYELFEVEREMKCRLKRTWEASEAKESWSWTSDAKEQRSMLPEAEEKIVKTTESRLTSWFRKPGFCRFWSSNPSSGIVVSSCHERERERERDESVDMAGIRRELNKLILCLCH